MIATFVGIALLFVSGGEIAYVDLSGPPKHREPATPGELIGPAEGRGVRMGGSFHRGGKPSPDTPPISVRLDQILPYVDRESGQQKWALEVVVTNTGKTGLSIPVGDDDDAVMADKDGDRRCLGLQVRLGDRLSAIIGSVESVSNSRQPASIARLQPGDAVRFRLPFDKLSASITRAKANDADLEVTVRASLRRVVVDDDHGYDLEEQIGDDVPSENSLPFWP
jgi:hypothetical protein